MEDEEVGKEIERSVGGRKAVRRVGYFGRMFSIRVG